VLYWGIGIVAAFAILFYISVKLNRRTCLLAFAQGFQDACSLPWKDIKDKYRSYLRPIRPMDAAAYKRGVEYCLLRIEGDGWEKMKRDFNDSWKSGSITREGTTIRNSGADNAEKSFRLSIPEQLEELILQNPNIPPLHVKVRFEEAGT